MSSATREHKRFTLLLVHWLKDNWPPELPRDWPFTSISVNCDYAAKRHRDKLNAGPSLWKCFGDFRGGKLRYWPRDPGSKKLRDISTLREQDAVLLDGTGEHALVFDGKCAHAVEPFEGKRFSLVFFTSGQHAKASKKVKHSLEKLGFRFPTAASLRRAEKTARAIRRRMCRKRKQ